MLEVAEINLGIITNNNENVINVSAQEKWLKRTHVVTMS